MKEIGDGSFGSVALARVRTAGSHIARRGTLVSFSDCSSFGIVLRATGCHQNHEEDI